MLIKASKEDVEQYIEYVYGLSQDYRTSAFPTYLDGIKTREEFIQTARDAFRKNTDEEILLFQKERVLGWIHYYYLDEDQYIGFMSFNIEEDYPLAIDEFAAYCEAHYPGYQINYGFPAENQAAITHLQNLGYEMAEDSDVFVLHFDAYTPVEPEGDIRRVTPENWADFKALHDQNLDMYWNSERLYQVLLEPEKHNPWQLYLYYKKGRPVANIYYTYVLDGTMMEIFGMDRAEEGENPAILRRLLQRACGESKKDGLKHLVYFAEAHEREIVESVGMAYLTKYLLYRNR